VKKNAFFLNLSQRTRWKIYSSGLVNVYGTNEGFRLKIRLSPALAFIHSNWNIPEVLEVV